MSIRLASASAIPLSTAKLVVDSLESVLRMAEHKRNIRDITDPNRSQWCLVVVKASSALLEAYRARAECSPKGTVLTRKQLQHMLAILSGIMEASEVKSRTQGGTSAKNYMPAYTKQEWSRIAVDASLAYLATARELGILENSEEKETDNP